MNNDDARPKKGKQGGNLRGGFRWDKSSPEYKLYRRRLHKSMLLATRKKLEAKNKAPLPGRVYKNKPKKKHD